jgi:peptidoglycan/xylan/chitin deacetylase (PgdA/CDA1 family)
VRDHAAGHQHGPRRIAVLGYHKIGACPDGRRSWFYIPEAFFEQQLRWIADNGWRVVDIQQFLTGLASPDTLTAKSVLLTFDDGYRSITRGALSVLRGSGLPAVLFVPGAFIGGSNDFDAGIEPEEAICDWEDLLELEQEGVSIQSHGISHRRLSTLDQNELEREIIGSKELLDRRLGRAVDVFSYPYGDCGNDGSDFARVLRRAGYRAAFGFGGRPITLPISDVFRIERIPMGPDTDLAVELENA